MVIINIGFGSLVLVFEMGRNAQFRIFRIYVLSNTKIAAAGVVILAITDIEALTILSSKRAGLRSLSAKITTRTQRYIYWLSVIGLIIEDIPQFIIQAIYFRHVTEYDFIPMLTLFITATSTAVNLVSKFFECIEREESRRASLANVPESLDLTIYDRSSNRTSVISIQHEEGSSTELTEFSGIATGSGSASGSAASGSNVGEGSSGLRIRSP